MKTNRNFLLLLCTACAVLLLPGCTTVTPEQVHASVASYDGTNQNSGVISFTSDGSAIITAHARDRYNALVCVYSKKFLPPLLPDDGLKFQSPNWVIDPQHLNYFKAMNRWKKEGLKP